MLLWLVHISILLVSGQPAWTWSIHPESDFKVLAPVTLQYNLKEIPTEAGRIQYHQYTGGSLQDTIGGMAFVIDHYQLPLPSDSADDHYFREFFDATIDQLLTSVNGTLVYADHLFYEGKRECVWKASLMEGKVIVRGNLMVFDDKYYGLQVFGWAQQKPEESMTRFLESFKKLDETHINTKP